MKMTKKIQYICFSKPSLKAIHLTNLLSLFPSLQKSFFLFYKKDFLRILHPVFLYFSTNRFLALKFFFFMVVEHLVNF